MKKENWSCEHCEEEYESKEEALLHEAVCLHSSKKWTCKSCRKKFLNEYYYLKHVISHSVSEDEDPIEPQGLLQFLYKSLIIKYHPDKTNTPELKKIFIPILP